MLLSLQSAATGMEAQQLNLNTISNNLANVNTTGFKRSKTEFQDLLYERQRASGADSGNGTNTVPTGVEVGNGSRVVSTAKIFTQGQLNETDQNTDLAINGDGFFEIQRPDGTSAYTRDGSFKIDSTGRVTTSDGFPVLSGFQTIAPNATNIAVASNGQVTVQGPNGTQTFRLTLTHFNNPAGLQSVGGNLYLETPASGAPATGNPSENGYGSITQGFLEGSNVNVAEEMVNMIMAQRAYEVNSKAIQTSDEMLNDANQLKR
jgi:flagellar basal-body rod protein FlgG